MDQPAEDGNYYYQNKDLGFKATLPPEFAYYQTQRVAQEDFIDIEFYVPTSDEAYRDRAFPGYAMPLVVRVFKKDAWKKMNYDEANAIYKKFGEKNNYVQTYKLWEEIPGDWEGKWNEDMAQKIIENLKNF